jgi:aldose 1-epimerase
MWVANPILMPVEKVAAATLIDLVQGQKVANAPFIDNTFTGWKGPARITQPELGLEVELSASGCSFFHVFIPDGADYFCAEPTTAMPDAFNRQPAESGAKVLQAGATASISMQLIVRKL